MVLHTFSMVLHTFSMVLHTFSMVLHTVSTVLHTVGYGIAYRSFLTIGREGLFRKLLCSPMCGEGE